jgi:D-alanyl-D-alanine dipeptidase
VLELNIFTRPKIFSYIIICVLILAALNETLDAEVRRLRRTVAELGGESLLSSLMARQLAINQQMFQSQHQQPNQLRNFQPQNSQSQEETQTQSQQHIQRNHEFQSKHQNGKTTA